MKVKTKYEVHIYVMWALQCMHDDFLKRHSFCWALHAKWYPSVIIDKENPKLNTTLGAGSIEVKVKTKYVVHIYVMLALQCMHANLL